MDIFQETSCWSEITYKRKAKNWGKENQPVSWKESRDYNGHASSSRAITGQPSSSWKQPRDRSACASSTGASGRKQPNDVSLEFEKFMPLTDLPKVCFFDVDSLTFVCFNIINIMGAVMLNSNF